MRKFHFTLLLMVVLLLVIGLSVALTANDPLAENKARMRDFYDEVFNKHNLDAFDEFCTADFVDHNLPPGYAPGREGVKQLFKGFFAGFPDLQVSVEDIIAEGDKVAARVTVRGTHKGEFMGIAATGKEITLSVMDFVRISEGKAVERWGVEDMLGMMHQLGVIPAPEGAEK